MKQVRMFGPNSFKRAKRYAGERYSGNWQRRNDGLSYRDPYFVFRAPDGRYVVCNFAVGLRLERQGFKPVS